MNKIYLFILGSLFLFSSLPGASGSDGLDQPDSQVAYETGREESLPVRYEEGGECEKGLDTCDSCQPCVTSDPCGTCDPCAASDPCVACNSCCGEPWDIWIYPSYLYVGYTGGRGISYRRGYGTLGAFFAPTYLSTTNWKPFIDLKGYCFEDNNNRDDHGHNGHNGHNGHHGHHRDNNRWGASVGVGVRQILTESCFVLGYNLYYDYRRFSRCDLNQIGVGLELLGPLWDVRINGYIPAGRSRSRRGTLFDFSGGYFAVRKERVSAWYGVDAEIGAWLKRKYACDWLGIYAAIGPYYYDRERRFHHHGSDDDNRHHRRDDAFGGRIRLLARVWDFVDLSVIATYDRVWHTRVQGQITVAIPFDCMGKIFNQCEKKCCSQASQSCCQCSSPCLLNQIAIQPVERNGIIVADKECCWLWNWCDEDSCCRHSSGPRARSVCLSDFDFSHDCSSSSSHSSSRSNPCFSSSFFDHSSKCSHSSERSYSSKSSRRSH